jgi:hypothetical protein
MKEEEIKQIKELNKIANLYDEAIKLSKKGLNTLMLLLELRRILRSRK